MKLVYIGPKPVKRDNVTNSAYIWAGYGDCQEVPADIGRRLLAFPTVWVTEQKFAEMEAVSKAAQAEKENEQPEDNGQESESELPDGLGEQSETTEGAPASSVSRIDAVKAAILSLKPGNDEHFSAKTGTPLTEAVKAIMKDDSVSFKEVVAAWNELKTGAAK